MTPCLWVEGFTVIDPNVYCAVVVLAAAFLAGWHLLGDE